jgi:hypothetical protein
MILKRIKVLSTKKVVSCPLKVTGIFYGGVDGTSEKSVSKSIFSWLPILSACFV